MPLRALLVRFFALSFRPSSVLFLSLGLFRHILRIFRSSSGTRKSLAKIQSCAKGASFVRISPSVGLLQMVHSHLHVSLADITLLNTCMLFGCVDGKRKGYRKSVGEFNSSVNSNSPDLKICKSKHF